VKTKSEVEKDSRKSPDVLALCLHASPEEESSRHPSDKTTTKKTLKEDGRGENKNRKKKHENGEGREGKGTEEGRELLRWSCLPRSSLLLSSLFPSSSTLSLLPKGREKEGLRWPISSIHCSHHFLSATQNASSKEGRRRGTLCKYACVYTCIDISVRQWDRREKEVKKKTAKSKRKGRLGWFPTQESAFATHRHT
jgi:hypothetical protein